MKRNTYEKDLKADELIGLQDALESIEDDKELAYNNQDIKKYKELVDEEKRCEKNINLIEIESLKVDLLKSGLKNNLMFSVITFLFGLGLHLMIRGATEASFIESFYTYTLMVLSFVISIGLLRDVVKSTFRIFKSRSYIKNKVKSIMKGV